MKTTYKDALFHEVIDELGNNNKRRLLTRCGLRIKHYVWPPKKSRYAAETTVTCLTCMAGSPPRTDVAWWAQQMGRLKRR